MCIPAIKALFRGVARVDSLWPQGKAIKVAFLDGSEWQHEQVREFASEWLEYINLSFLWVPGRRGDVRISVREDSGSWSQVGTDALNVRNGATMNLGWILPEVDECERKRVTLHEFGHMLGLEHEHQSPNVKIPWDREAVYKWAAEPPNFWSRKDVDNNYFRAIDSARASATDFDPLSIMLYPVSPEMTAGRMSIDWNNTLSTKDIEFVSSIYPRK